MFALISPLLAADPTPDTSGYMIAGYIVIFGIMLFYLISLVVRNRNLRQDMETLEELEKKEPEDHSDLQMKATEGKKLEG